MPPLKTPSPDAGIAIDDANYSDLTSIPWANTLLESPDWARIPYTSRLPSYGSSDNRTFALLRRTLATPSTIRAFVVLHRRIPSTEFSSIATPLVSGAVAALPAPEPPSPPIEVICLISIGTPGLDGWPGIAHGGIVAVLLDEVLGAACEEVLGIEVRTAWLRIEFKRGLTTPGVVLGRAKIRKTEGRKAWIDATLEDGEGGVFATAESLYLKAREMAPRL